MPSALSVAADLLDPPAIPDPWVKIGYQPTPRQQAFHEATEWDVLYGGAMGGGKSKALTMEGIAACVRYPGIEVWAFRKTIDQLRGSLIKELRQVEMCKALGARWNVQLRELRFSNGSLFRFCYAENETDAMNYFSQDCQLLILDERQQMDPSIAERLSLRVRSGSTRIPVLGIRSGANPGDIGHAYLRDRFVDAAPWNTTIVPERGERLRRFIPAKSTDNPHLNDDYELNFEDISDPVMRQAYRDGNWDVFAGMAFPEWDRAVHVVDPEDYPIPAGGIIRARGIDYGLVNPFACLWGAKLHDGLVVVYRELYRTELTPTSQAGLILASEDPDERLPGRPMSAYLDPSCWNRQPDSPASVAGRAPAKSIASDYAIAGLPVTRAYNDRIGGKRLVHDGLRVAADGRPRLLIYSTCVNLIRQLGSLPRDKKHPEDVDTKAEDHAYDALRYLLGGLLGRVPNVGGAPRAMPKAQTAALSRAGF